MRFGSRLFSDASGSAQDVAPDGRPNWSKFDHATATAAAMAYITINQGDRVGLAVYADELLAMVERSARKSSWKQSPTSVSSLLCLISSRTRIRSGRRSRR